MSEKQADKCSKCESNTEYIVSDDLKDVWWCPNCGQLVVVRYYGDIKRYNKKE